MRLFFAIDFPAEVKDALMRYQTDLRGSGVTGRFVRRDTLHLTLRFLGETPPAQVEAAKQAAKEASRGHSAFSLHTAAPGSFGRGRGGAVLWIGLERCAPLLEVQEKLEMHLARQGFDRETKPFRPHITMARDADWRSPRLPALERLIIPAKGITLFESRRDTVTGRYRYIPLLVTSFEEN